MIRVVLPHHLRTLAHIGREVQISPEGEATLAGVLEALETQYPVLRGTIRDQVTKERRPFIRFFACGQDLSHLPPHTELPENVIKGLEPFRVVGAMAGG
jgi:hypothetical protein